MSEQVEAVEIYQRQKYGDVTALSYIPRRDRWLCECKCGRKSKRTAQSLLDPRSQKCRHISFRASREAWQQAHQLHLRVIPPPEGVTVQTSPGFERGPGDRHDSCVNYLTCLDTWSRETIVGTGHVDPRGHCPAACIGYSETEPWRFLALAAHHARGEGAIEPAAYDD